jgi:hypothetical protein
VKSLDLTASRVSSSANAQPRSIGRPPVLCVAIPKRTECRPPRYRSAAIVVAPSIPRRRGTGSRSVSVPMRAAPERGGSEQRRERAGMAERTDPRSRRYLSVAELVARYERRVSARTLRRWRSTGAGPSWIRLGLKILYPLDDLERWEQARPGRPMLRGAKSSTEATPRHVGTSGAFSSGLRAGAESLYR